MIIFIIKLPKFYYYRHLLCSCSINICTIISFNCALPTCTVHVHMCTSCVCVCVHVRACTRYYGPFTFEQGSYYSRKTCHRHLFLNLLPFDDASRVETLGYEIRRIHKKWPKQLRSFCQRYHQICHAIQR